MCTGKPNGALRQRRTELYRRIIWNRISCRLSDCSKGCILLSFPQPCLPFHSRQILPFSTLLNVFLNIKNIFVKILKLIYAFCSVFQWTYLRRKVRRSREKIFACLYFLLRIHNGEAASSGKMAAASVGCPTMQQCSKHFCGHFQRQTFIN